MNSQIKNWQLCIFKMLILGFPLLYQHKTGLGLKPKFKSQLKSEESLCLPHQPLFLCKLLEKLEPKNSSRKSRFVNSDSKQLRDRTRFSHSKILTDSSRRKKFNFLGSNADNPQKLFAISPLVNEALQRAGEALVFDWSAPGHSGSSGRQVNCASSGTLSEDKKENLVEEHNRERRRVSPPASNMRLMTWDDELAFLAARHTLSCKYRERGFDVEWDKATPGGSIERHHVLNAEVGFNWFAWGGVESLPDDFASQVMGGWMEEQHYFDAETRTCSAVCRHYLQVVWAQSYKIGCATSCCSIYDINGVIWRSTTMLLCAYSPRGNVLDFRSDPFNAGSYLTPFKVRSPYLHGPGCQKCDADPDQAASSSANGLVLGKNQKLERFFRMEALEFCDNLLCANNDRDKLIPFIQRPSGTTTFAWGSVTVVTTPPFVSTLRNPNPTNSVTSSSANPHLVSSIWTLAAACSGFAFLCFCQSL